MKVRQGWSGQVSKNPDQWAKFDITLEEEDLRRLVYRIAEDSDDIDHDDAELFLEDRLHVQAGYRLLEVEAEILVYTKLIVRYGFPGDQGREKLEALSKQKQDVIAAIKKTMTEDHDGE